MKNLLSNLSEPFKDHVIRWTWPVVGVVGGASSEVPTLTAWARDLIVWLTLVSLMCGLYLQLRAIFKKQPAPLPEPVEQWDEL